MESRKEVISKVESFRIIYSLRNKFSISLLCDIAIVSRSGYYKWCTREKQDKDAFFIKKILHVYKKSKNVYGYRRIKVALKREFGLIVNTKKILRLMRKLNIHSIVRKKKFKYVNSISNEYTKAMPNILKRDFSTTDINQKWVTDITYLHYGTPRKRAYLSALMDLYNNEIIAYKLSDSLEIEFVENTIKDALNNRKNLKNLIIHSDQGCHYMSRAYKTILKQNNIIQSMSRKGNCYDNACIESFFGKLKTELIYQNKYNCKEELFNDIEKYIAWYNTERFQSKLKNRTPVEYRSAA